MSEYRELAIGLVQESVDNPRKIFSADALEELRLSLCQHGMIEPIVARPAGKKFIVIAGARRLRAARLAGWTTVPVFVSDKDPAQADLAAVAENLHRQDLTPLEEAQNYQRLLASKAPVYSLEDLELQVGKSRRYIYQRLMLLRLTPEIQELVAGNVLPLSFALKLATVPKERQAAALEICFHPLFRDEKDQRHALAPLANLTRWLRDNVRRDPHGQDTQMLLPEVAAAVATKELERHRTMLKVSELTFHTDRSDPDIILCKSWKYADDPDNRCDFARPAIVVLGPNQDRVLDVCTAKKQCQKHWPSPSATAAPSETACEGDDEASDTAPALEELDWQKERRLWINHHRPRMLRQIAEGTTDLKWSWPMLSHVLTAMEDPNADMDAEAAELADILGPLEKIPVKRYPQVIAVAFAIQYAGNLESLSSYAERLGVSITSDDDVSPETLAAPDTFDEP